MFRIDDPSASATLPTPEAAGTPGYFTEGTPGSLAATLVRASFLNMVQEEFISVLVAAGITPSKTTYNQLLLAVRRLAQKTTVLTDTGVANSYAAVNVPALVAGDLVTGLIQRVNVLTLNTGASTYSPDGLPGKPIFGMGLAALQGGEMPAKGIAVLMYIVASNVNAGAGGWILIECTGGAVQVPTATQPGHALNQAAGDARYAIATSISSKIQPLATPTVASNALTIGVNSTILDFRSPMLGSSAVNTRILAALASLTIPSGASLGAISAQSADFIVGLMDNAGTLEPFVVNLAGGIDLTEMGLISTTAISASATSASVAYSATARTNLPYRIVGTYRNTQATAGTYVTLPSLVQGYGGQALAAMGSIGFGQTDQNMTGSRAFATTYYNTTGKPITLVIYATGGTGGSMSISLNGRTAFPFAYAAIPSGNIQFTGTIIVPPGSYNITQTGGITINIWTEIR